MIAEIDKVGADEIRRTRARIYAVSTTSRKSKLSNGRGGPK